MATENFEIIALVAQTGKRFNYQAPDGTMYGFDTVAEMMAFVDGQVA